MDDDEGCVGGVLAHDGCSFVVRPVRAVAEVDRVTRGFVGVDPEALAGVVVSTVEGKEPASAAAVRSCAAWLRLSLIHI